MNGQPARRNLLANLQPQNVRPAPQAEDDILREAAELHGFTGTGSQPPMLRRKRSGAGRTHQLNVRVRPDTASVIYEEANRRDVPIAQVIEEAIAALLSSRR